MSCNCDAKKKKFSEEFYSILEEYQGEKGALIPVLQRVQNLLGYLPEDAMREIGEILDIDYSEIYGVATFYAQFHLNPRGKYVIKVCRGTACHVRGSKKILERLQDELQIGPGQTTEDEKFTLETVNCIGACGLAPVMMINEDTYGRLTPDQVKDILEKYE